MVWVWDSKGGWGRFRVLFPKPVNYPHFIHKRVSWARLLCYVSNCRDYPDLVLDGRIGESTLSALDSFLKVRGKAGGETVLLRAMEALQGERYLRLAERRPANEAFLYGWLANRIGNRPERCGTINFINFPSGVSNMDRQKAGDRTNREGSRSRAELATARLAGADRTHRLDCRRSGADRFFDLASQTVGDVRAGRSEGPHGGDRRTRH